MEVKFKKLVPEAIIPSYAHEGDAGLDMTAIAYEYDAKKDCHIYKTGIAMEIPKGHVGLVFPRSSNRKTNAYMCNHVGIIDSGYRGDIMFSFKNRTLTDCRPPYKVGDKIGQLIIVPYPIIELSEVNELEDSERGENGHGSTGR